MNVAAWLGTHLYSAALVLLIALPALVTVGGSDYRSTAVLPPLTPVAVTLDTTTEDALAEGMDVVPVSFHDAPYDLWSGLRDQYPGAYLDDVPGIGTFYVPAGSTIDVPGGLYLATLDGWAQCRDEWSAQECSATGPVVLLDIPARTADSVYRDDPAALAADRALAGLGIMTEGATTAQVRNVAQVTTTASPARLSRACVKAARNILHASLSRSVRVEEDLSYRGAPRRVGECNDLLAEAYFAGGHDFTGRHGKPLRDFLRQVIRTGTLPVASNQVTHPQMA